MIKTVEQIKNELHRFEIEDYLVFGVMLVGCGLLGIYFAMKSSKKNKSSAAEEFIMGGHSMTVFPISMSLIATYISGISLMGIPTEIYLYGIEFLFILLTIFPMGLLTAYVILPVFHKLQLKSVYEYLEMRFDRNIRMLGSILFTAQLVCWLPIVIYVPALAFNQVTGVNVHVTTPCVCAICIFYTCLGGLKAVVWTDFIQTVFMVGALFVTVVKATIDVGGLRVVWARNLWGDRLTVPSLNLDFTTRHTMWGLTFGLMISWLQAGLLNQNMIQRYSALATLRQARWAMCIYLLGTSLIMILCAYAGLVAYSVFYNCDPLSTKLAKAEDQILPLLVMRTVGQIPGLPGLFVSGIFSASLSSLSTGLNSMSAVVLEDFVKPYRKSPLSEKSTLLLLRGVVLIFGAISVGLVFVVEQLGIVLQLSMSLTALSFGPQFGIFICALLLPWVNSKGVFYGGFIGLIGGGYVILGTQNAIMSGMLRFPKKYLETFGCDYYFNPVLQTQFNKTLPESTVFPLYKLSYTWYTGLGAVLTVVSALLISYLTGGFSTAYKVNRRTLSPVIRRWLKKPTNEFYLKVKEKELVAMLRRE